MAVVTLRELRGLAHMTQQKLARRTGIDAALLSQIESGAMPASEARIEKIRGVLLKVIQKRQVRMQQVLASTTRAKQSERSAAA